MPQFPEGRLPANCDRRADYMWQRSSREYDAHTADISKRYEDRIAKTSHVLKAGGREIRAWLADPVGSIAALQRNRCVAVSVPRRMVATPSPSIH